MVPTSKRTRVEENLLSVPGERLRLIFPNAHDFPSTRGPAQGATMQPGDICYVGGVDDRNFLEFQRRTEVKVSGGGRGQREERQEIQRRRGLLRVERKEEEREGEVEDREQKWRKREKKEKESRRGAGNSPSSGRAVPSSLAFPGMASDTRTMRRGKGHRKTPSPCTKHTIYNDWSPSS